MILDLFAGAGGWSKGIADLGQEDVGIELNESACKTRRQAGFRTIRADISVYPPTAFSKRFTGLIASPPCQDFSIAGKKVGIMGYKGRLIFEVIRWSTSLQPAWIACEQVPTCLPIWEDFSYFLRESLGYFVWTGILNSADFGVPQTRKRAVLMASKTKFNPPTQTHAAPGSCHDIFGASYEEWVSVANALGWEDSDFLGAQRMNDRDDGHERRERDLRICSEPAFTLTHYAIYWNRVRPTEDIPVTLQDLSILQGFPAAYPWVGNKTQQVLQLANAIPPPLAKAIIRELLPKGTP